MTKIDKMAIIDKIAKRTAMAKMDKVHRLAKKIEAPN